MTTNKSLQNNIISANVWTSFVDKVNENKQNQWKSKYVIKNVC